ncbi:hypothetical protein B8W90_13970, partial [Staphylococcus hominis]
RVRAGAAGGVARAAAAGVGGRGFVFAGLGGRVFRAAVGFQQGVKVPTVAAAAGGVARAGAGGGGAAAGGGAG